MRIIVCGCGKIGKTIVAALVREKHDITVMDASADVVHTLVNEYDVMGVVGNGTDYDRLKEAGAERADLLVATTSSDELNMLAAFAAKRMGTKATVARIRDLENNDDSLEFMERELDLSLSVNPEKLTAEAIYNVIRLPSAIKVETFGSKRLEMIEFLVREDSPYVGMTLAAFKKESKENFLIAAVLRDGEVFIPNGSFTLAGGDRVGLVASDVTSKKLLTLLSESGKAIKDVVILGAGREAAYLAKRLMRAGVAVKIIEKDAKKCEEICRMLGGGITVITGDGMSQDLLTEEGVPNASAFVALTEKDEENVLTSFYAISKKVPKVVAKVSRSGFSEVIENLGLSCIVNPRQIAADVVVRYVRSLANTIGSEIQTLYSLFGGALEAVEFKVLDGFPKAGVPLKEITFKEGVLLAGILRGKDAVLPAGDDTLNKGDRVIVISKNRLNSLADAIK